MRTTAHVCLHYPEITEVINADRRTPTDTSGHTGSALVNEHYRIPDRNVRPRNANLTEKDRAVCRAYVFRIYTIWSLAQNEEETGRLTNQDAA